MLLAIALALAVFVLPAPWGIVVVLFAGVVEVAETAFWIRLSRRRAARVGPEALIGARGRVVASCRPNGRVRVAGELWQARCEPGADAGDDVRVAAREGLMLVVEPDSPPLTSSAWPGQERPSASGEAADHEPGTRQRKK